jgi:hypothetical protein
MKASRFVLPVAALAITTAFVGGWFIQRERAGDRLSNGVVGDVQVRRGSGGQCYQCRDGGWLYDIAFPHCAASDRPYRAG